MFAVVWWCSSLFFRLLTFLVFLGLGAGLVFFGDGFFDVIRRTRDECIAPITACHSYLVFGVFTVARVPVADLAQSNLILMWKPAASINT
jgi:hypothetical protein